MTSFWFFYIFFLFFIVMGGFATYYIMVTVGFRNLRLYYKAYSERKKGTIIVRIYQKIGSVNYMLAKKKGDSVVFVDKLDNEKSGSYVLDPEEIYRNEMGLNCLDYFEEDITPRSWRKRISMPMSPFTFNNIIANSVKSEVGSRSFEDWFKKYGYYIGIGVLILVGILAFVIISQNDQIVELSAKVAGSKVVVA